MITVALVCLFIACYHSNVDPPIGDIISPLITLSMVLEWERVVTGVMLATTMLESMADYRMDKDNMRVPILLFSLGHLVRQSAFLTSVDSETNTFPTLILAVTFMLIGVLMGRLYITRSRITKHVVHQKYREGHFVDDSRVLRRNGGEKCDIPRDAILYYATIVFLSAVNVTMIQQIPSWGYLVFIVSDLIIGYEITIRKIYPRWVRILLVPILYWGSQYLLKAEYLNLQTQVIGYSSSCDLRRTELITR